MPKDKKNILLWGFGNNCTCDVQNHLPEDINIKIWIDRRKYSTTTHDMTDFYKAFRISKKYNQLKINYQHRKEYIDIYEEVMKHANTFLYMHNRHPVLNGENNFMDMMDALHIYTHFFIDLLKTNRIDSIFFQKIPHHADFILYLVAKELNIKVFIFSPSTVPGKSILSADITQIGSIEVDGKDIDSVKIEKKEHKKYFYMGKHFIAHQKPNLYIKALSALLFRRDANLFFHRIMNIRKNSRFKKDYRHALSSLPSEGEFVYFPLHLQPEMTTHSLGEKFADQILAIEHLRNLLPDEWNIIVKENPKQTFHSRGSLFYARLKKIPKTFYIGKEHNTFELIEKSQFVSTITGSVGLEALSFGKRVLIFGNATYRDFPGVIRYTNNLTFDDIMSTQISHKELELAYAKLQYNMVDVIVNKRYVHLDKNFSAEDNAHALANIINKQIK